MKKVIAAISLSAVICFASACGSAARNTSSASTVSAESVQTVSRASSTVSSVQQSAAQSLPESAAAESVAAESVASSTPVQPAESAAAGTNDSYQSILDEYTQKITEAAPQLVDEFNEEAAGKNGDINALAELSNSKV